MPSHVHLGGGEGTLVQLNGYYHDVAPVGARLHLHIYDGWSRSEPIAQWSDSDKKPLENQIGAITAEFFVQAEASYRSTRISEHSRRGAMKAERLESIRRAKERAETAERERVEKAAADRLALLLSLAEKHDQAERIRALVKASKGKNSAWSDWALNAADDLDPVRTGSLLSLNPSSGAK